MEEHSFQQRGVGSGGDNEDVVMTMCVLQNVQNMGEVVKLLRTGAVHGSLLKPQVVPAAFLLKSATFKALESLERGQMATKTLFSEILYNLYPRRQIRSAFSEIGVGAKDDSVIVITLKNHNDPNEKDAPEDPMSCILDMVHGDVVSVQVLEETWDKEAVAKLYGISTDGKEVSEVVRDISTVLAAKFL